MWTEESGTPPPAWKSSWRGRPIKFRGRHVDTGEIYYGFYEMDARGNHFIIDSNNIMHIVDPESVAQLVGYDKDGREVYEGDILVDDDDTCRPLYKEFVVSFKVHGRKHGMVVDFETNPRRYRLKEAAQ